MKTVLPVILLASLAPLAGCGSAGRGTEGGACREDGTCNQGLTCAYDKCIKIRQCTENANCPEGKYCDLFYGLCIEGCREELQDCPEGKFCFAGTCYDPEGDQDQDGYNLMEDCDDGDFSIHPGAEERCNGRDDDCDGRLDEDLEARPSSRQQGVCEGSLMTCYGSGGWLDPDFASLPYYEFEESSCDGRDNDCDGQTDEDLPAPHASRQLGVCQGTRRTCDGQNGWIEPDYESLPGYESSEVTCDGLDNDCDAFTDERLGAPPADLQDGVCAGLEKVCAGTAGWVEPDYGALVDYQSPEASCDGRDNDCDGQTDEDLVAPDADLQAGVCAGAKKVCGSYGWVEPDYSQIPDYLAWEGSTCDGLDNNCDGAVDEVYDFDGDGYYDGSFEECLTYYQPLGLIDCDDRAAAFNQSCVVYVDGSATAGLGDGSSWEDAMIYLQDALAYAGPDYQIWVAAGTYRPDQGYGQTPGDREASFQQLTGAQVYGGFAGGESALDQRDWRANESILSGDLHSDDGPDFENTSENSLRVVTVVDHLDGFVISGGNADTSPAESGGGMFISTSSPVMVNCTFRSNQAADRGGAIYAYWSSTPYLQNCIFHHNRAGGDGGAIAGYWSSAPAMVNCLLFDNHSQDQGGAIYIEWSGELSLINTTVAGNTAVTGGGGVYNSAYGDIVNSVFFGNTPDPLWGGGNQVSYTCLPGVFEGTANIDLSADPFQDAGYHLLPASACVDSGNNAALPPEVTLDLDGNPRIANGTVDRGAYENH